MALLQFRKVEGVKVQIMEFQKDNNGSLNSKIIIINCQNNSGKSRKFSRSRMTKWTTPLSSSHEI